MLENWVGIALGWPAMGVALLCSVLGIVRSRAWLLLVAVLLIAPVCLYLAGTPLIGWFGLAPLLLLCGAALAVRWDRAAIAWALWAPVVGAAAWLILRVQGQ